MEPGRDDLWRRAALFVGVLALAAGAVVCSGLWILLAYGCENECSEPSAFRIEAIPMGIAAVILWVAAAFLAFRAFLRR